MTLQEAIYGSTAPRTLLNELSLVDVPYRDFKGLASAGQLLLHREIAARTSRAFEELFKLGFPIARMVPIVAYDWDDDASMKDDNTSAFNYRFIAHTDRLSNHAFGLAIDINPQENPYTDRLGNIVPEGSAYDLTSPGTISSEIATIFKELGFSWGGDWTGAKDWQHFEFKIG